MGGLTFGVDIVLTRLLNPSDFGLVGLTIFFVTVAQTVVDSAMTSSLVRAPEADDSDYSTVWFANLGIGIFLYICLFVCSVWIADFYDQPSLIPLIRVYSLGILLIALAAVQQARMTRNMDFKTLGRIQVTSRIIAGIGGIGFAYSGCGVWSLVYMFLLQQAALVVQNAIHWKWIPLLSDFDRQKLKRHFGFGSRLGLSFLIDSVFTNIYSAIIGKYFSPVTLGYFTKANQLKQMPINIISGTLTTSTFPLFASIQSEPEKLRAVYTKLMKQVIFWIAPLLTGGIVLAKPLIELLFTEKWLPVVPYFQLMCISGILYPINAYNVNILKVFGRTDLLLKAEIIKKAIVIVMILLTIQHGIFVLLIGQVATSLAGFMINTYFNAQFIRYPARNQLRDVLPVIGISVLMGVCVATIDYYLPSSLLVAVRLSIGCALGIIIYLAISKLLRVEAYGDIWQLVQEFAGRNKMFSQK